MSSHPRDKALAEIVTTAARPDDHSEQHKYMSTHSRDKALAEIEPTAAHVDDHS
jgi:hypothetical protein